MAQLLTISNECAQMGNAAEFRSYLNDALGGNDRMDEPRSKVRVSDGDAVPIVGPRGGIRRYTTSVFRDDVCEDGDAEETLVARIDARAIPLEDEGVLFIEEDDADDEDWPMFVGGVALDAYLAEFDENGDPLPEMSETEWDHFNVITLCIDLDTAIAARREGNLQALHDTIDRITAPPPPAMTAGECAEVLERTYPFNVLCMADPTADDPTFEDEWPTDGEPHFGKAFETAPGIELDAIDDLRPYERLAAAAEAERDPSFLRRRSN